jgi:membrane protease subunit (stomatin/prohibitin family)
MGLFGFMKKQFIDVIDWTEEGEGTLAYRYPMEDKEIQNGALLTVREGQAALFVNEGEVADLFTPGLHTINTRTLPILTNLQNWDKGFDSPFKSDVYYFIMKDQLDQRWGTPNPITIRDKDFGHIRLRAHGTYTFKVSKPELFYKKVSGTKGLFRVDDIDDQLRSIIITGMTTFLASSGVPFIDMAGNQNEFSEKLKESLAASFKDYGLKLQSFLVQNLSLPQELQDYLDKGSKMNMVGDLRKYAQFESADNIGTAAANEGGGAGIGAGLGAGMAMGQQMMGTMSDAQAGGQSEEDVLATIEKLHGMKEKGILSEEEFNTKKSELLKKLT